MSQYTNSWNTTLVEKRMVVKFFDILLIFVKENLGF
jgi:hypothetical protein